MARRLGILLSGRGSNFRAISDAINEGTLDAEIAVVLSNSDNAPGLELARARGIHTWSLSSKGMAREAYDRQLAEELHHHKVDLICLAGYMRILSPEFIRQFPHKILNIHPSLLPAFPGVDVQRQALEHGVKISGCTVHFVDEGLDSGPILLQASVPVLDTDTVDTLSTRILKEEHRIYSEAIAIALSGKLRFEGRRVVGGG